MKKIFSLLAAVLFAGSMMAAVAPIAKASDKAYDVTVNGKTGVKVGTSSVDGSLTVTVAAGATKLTFHAVAWTGVPGNIKIAVPGAEEQTMDVAANAGISGSGSSYTLTDAQESDFVKELTLSNITEETVITFSSGTARRFVIWDANDDTEAPAEEPVAEEAVVYNWAKDAANQVGTTILAEAGVAVSTVKIHTNTDAVDCLNFSKSLKTDSFYVAIKPAEGSFKAGDVLHIACCYSNTAEKRAAIKVLAANWTDSLYCTANGINGRLVNDNPVEETYTLAADQDSLILGRYGNTGTCVTLLKVVRPAAQEETEELVVLNVAEAIAAATATPAQIVANDSITVRGVVSKLEFKGKNFVKYGSVSVYATDATGAEGTFTFYNCYSLEADTFKTSSPEYDSNDDKFAFYNSVTDGNGVSMWVGDTVIARGKYELKSGAYRLAQGCYLTEIIAGPRVEPAPAVDPEPIEGAISVAKAIELVNAMKDGATSTHEFTVEGYVVNAAEFSWSSLSQLFFLADDAENSGNQVFEAYYCTGMENGQAIPLINGDKVRLTGKLQKYVKNGTEVTPEISNAPAVIIEKAAGERPAAPTIIEKTVAEALEIGKTVANDSLSADYYSISGYITAFAGTDGSFWMADAADGGKDKNTAFEVYKGVSEATLQVGDKVNVVTRIKNYKGTIESETSAIVTVVEALKIDTINVATAVDLALQLGDNTASTKDYVVIGNVAKIATVYSDQFHNISFFMTDDAVSAEAEGALKVYQGGIDEAAGKALAPGDRVMVVGKLYNNFYNNANTAQIAKGSKVTVMWKQALEQIVLTEKVNKVIVDGVIYIVRDGKLYNLQGAQVR